MTRYLVNPFSVLPNRGLCQDCGVSYQLRKDGTVRGHSRWFISAMRGNRKGPCPGSFQKPRGMRP